MARILVLGSGFAGLWAAVGGARKLAELGIPRGQVEILVVERNPYHGIRVRNYEPDLETAKWTPAQGSNDWYGTMEFKESMFECFPPAESVNAIVEPHAYDGSR